MAQSTTWRSVTATARLSNTKCKSKSNERKHQILVGLNGFTTFNLKIFFIHLQVSHVLCPWVTTGLMGCHWSFTHPFLSLSNGFIFEKPGGILNRIFTSWTQSRLGLLSSTGVKCLLSHYLRYVIILLSCLVKCDIIYEVLGFRIQISCFSLNWQIDYECIANSYNSFKATEVQSKLNPVQMTEKKMNILDHSHFSSRGETFFAVQTCFLRSKNLRSSWTIYFNSSNHSYYRCSTYKAMYFML